MEKMWHNQFISKKYLLIIVLVFIVYNFYTMSLFAEHFKWEAGLDFILAKSSRIPLFFLFWILIIPFVLKLKEKFPFSMVEKKNVFIHIIFCFVLSVVIEFLTEFLTISVLYLFENTLYKQRLNRVFDIYYIMLVNISLVNVVIYWLILTYQSSLEYFTKFKTESIRRSEAENLIVKAELNALKMQIQPHFLFNTLHSVSSLIDEDKEEAQDVIGRLGELLRYTLDQESDFITLQSELAFIRNYLGIEKIRFKDRLLINYQIDKESEAALVPSFILQPIIENTIKHGLSKTNKQCTVRISSSIENDKLNIKIIDDGNGSEIIAKGIGLDNTENRLKNYYGSNYEFTYKNLKETGFSVLIKIPLKFESKK